MGCAGVVAEEGKWDLGRDLERSARTGRGKGSSGLAPGCALWGKRERVSERIILERERERESGNRWRRGGSSVGEKVKTW